MDLSETRAQVNGLSMYLTQKKNDSLVKLKTRGACVLRSGPRGKGWEGELE